MSPLGFGRQQFWNALCAGRSGIAPIEAFAVPAGSPRMAAEVRGFAAREFIASSHLRRMDKLSRMVVAASRMALDDARLSGAALMPDRVGVVIGSALGDLSESVQHLHRVFTKGPAFASPMIFPNLLLNAPASYVAMELGLTGVNLTVSQSETAGEQALILACDTLRRGRADVVLAGGGDELAPLTHQIAVRRRALSSQRGGPEWCSPYDRDRNGVVLGEGAGMLALELLTHARRRGATVLAEVEDYALFAVPARPYDWPRRADAALPTLRRLVASGTTGAVDLVCGAGNSSPNLDACEVDLLDRLFADAGAAVRLTSIKGAVGEFGAAGALNAVAGALALREQIVPPLCNLHSPEASAALRYARPPAQAQALQRVLLCGLGRGGVGAAVLLRKSPPVG